MAVIEIAKIKVRRGQENVTGLPTLDSGEFGWAVDTQRLYIGNGTLAEGAPEVGNTRLLTEEDFNIFNQGTYLAQSKLTLARSASTGTTTLYLSTLTSVDQQSNGVWRELSGPGIQSGTTITNISTVSSFNAWPITISNTTTNAISSGTVLSLSYYASNSYSYLDNDHGQHRGNVPIYTDPSGEAYTYRNTFDKLNDFVTIFDFAGVNDGVTDNTDALQNAIDQLWLNSDRNTSRSRVALRIPAGTYIVNDTIYIPPYTTLIGEGQEKTIIKLMTNNRSLMQTCDPTSTPGNYIKFGGSGSVLTDNTTNIQLIGITFEWDEAFGGFGTSQVQPTKPMLRIDAALDSQIIDCKFRGYYFVGRTGITEAGTDFTALEIRGQGVISTKDLLIQNCTFDGFYYGIYSNYDIEDTVIVHNTFRNLGKGIVGAQAVSTPDRVGPLRTKIQNNKFINIEQEGIVFFNTSVHAYTSSMNNSFVEVGNNITGELSSGLKSAVIKFDSQGNTSIGDFFNRFDAVNAATAGGYFKELIIGNYYVDRPEINKKSMETGVRELSRFPIAVDTQAINVTYSLRRADGGASVSRKGNLLLNVSLVGANSTVAVTDNYSYTGPNNGLVEFSATADTVTNTISLLYTNAGPSTGSITYKYNQLT